MTNQQKLDSLEVMLHRMVDRIRQSLELSVILSGATEEVRSFLGTDRVKIYQFAADGSGEVVAESIYQQNLPSLLGQHFPAEDIPNEVRQLYLQERQRTIVDVSRGQIGISSPISEREHQYIRFRPLDPCHGEYLTAMGVQSSLVVPIIDRDRLWGLLVSHHSLPHVVVERELEIVQLVADRTSIAIAQATLLESTRAQAKQEASINRVGRFLHSMTEMKLQKALQQAVLALQGSGGRIYITQQDADTAQLFVSGEQPVLLAEDAKRDLEQKPTKYLEQHSGWQTWLVDNLQTNNVSQSWAIADLDNGSTTLDWYALFKQTKIKSILILKLEYRQKHLGYLSIFRQGIDIETIWAKRPDLNDPRNHLPRQSFEVWRELQQNKPRKWTESEIELAQTLGNHFAIAVYQYQLYQQVRLLNTSLEQRVAERTAELQQANEKLVREISDRLKARADLERLSHQHELILNSAGEGIYGLDTSGKTTFVNPAAAEMLGYGIEELQGRSMHRVVARATGDSWQDSPIYQTVRTGKVQYILDEIFRRKDNSYFPVEYVSTPIREGAEIVGAVVIFKDITERQIIDRMKDEFVSVVSHELRTPLTSIHSAIGVLSKSGIDPRSSKSKRLLEIALDNSNRLVRLINDILDLERIKSGKVTMVKESHNLAEVMGDAIEIMQTIADKAEIELAVKPLSVELQIDRDRIMQTLTNLLDNAIKFSPPQTLVSLEAKLKDNNNVEFKVTDRGRGIPPENLETIFDRFQQVDASDSRDRGGTGLGLAICRSIVQQHGGKIWVVSVLGKGSVFYFTLPVSC